MGFIFNNNLVEVESQLARFSIFKQKVEMLPESLSSFFFFSPSSFSFFPFSSSFLSFHPFFFLVTLSSLPPFLLPFFPYLFLSSLHPSFPPSLFLFSLRVLPPQLKCSLVKSRAATDVTVW